MACPRSSEKKGEMKRGYGRYRPLGNESTAGTIEPLHKADAGGGCVFFPGAAFRDEGVLPEKLKRGQWLYYYALKRKPSAGCTAVTAEVLPATASDVIIKKTTNNVYVWSAKTSAARGGLVPFHEGTWVKFQFKQETENGSDIWVVTNVESLSPPPGVSLETDESLDSDEIIVHTRCPAVAVLSSALLNRFRSKETSGVQPFQPLRIWATYKSEQHLDGPDDEFFGDEATAASAHATKKMATESPWHVMACLVTSGAAASGADPPYPPPSIIFGVEAVVLSWESNDHNERGQHWILTSETYGKVFATPSDVFGPQKNLSVGDRVKVSIVPQMLSFDDEYRALVVEKLRSESGRNQRRISFILGD